jgi:hypothetical protein
LLGQNAGKTLQRKPDKIYIIYRKLGGRHPRMKRKEEEDRSDGEPGEVDGILALNESDLLSYLGQLQLGVILRSTRFK